MTLILAVYKYLCARCRSNTISHRHFQRLVREPINIIIAKILNPTLVIRFWHLASPLHSTDYLTSPSKTDLRPVLSHRPWDTIFQLRNSLRNGLLLSIYLSYTCDKACMTMVSTPSKSIISPVAKGRSLFLVTYKTWISDINTSQKTPVAKVHFIQLALLREANS